MLVKAFANIDGVQKALVQNQKIVKAANIRNFVRGFNQRRPLFDLIDVGYGKERADSNIRGI